VIQRNLTRAKTLINQSVAKFRDVSLSRRAANSTQESPQTDNKKSKSTRFEWILFTREALRNYRTIGAVWVSSQRLAQTMASFVPLTESGLIVELGSGTGIVTEALLQHGVAPERLVSIEQSASLADYLHQRFPDVQVIKGDAQHLCELLGDDCQRVSTIVSSLPFRSLPHAVGHGIIKQIDKILPKEGLLIQFTYDISGRGMLFPHHFKRVSFKTVWGNLPPARVNVYQSEQ